MRYGTLLAAAAMMALAATAPAAAQSRAADHVRADVEFMQGMIPHHEQALVMARMAPSSGASDRVRLAALRIELSQKDEIDLMKRWLTERGHPVAGEHTHHMAMPGMLSDEQLSELRAARGRDFDRLFLQFMIKHHEGALAMVETLFKSPGAAQEPELARLASDIDSDQRAEIDRMQQMLTNPPA
jgi:uncharacterized protein (DUF305 family)